MNSVTAARNPANERFNVDAREESDYRVHPERGTSVQASRTSRSRLSRPIAGAAWRQKRVNSARSSHAIPACSSSHSPRSRKRSSHGHAVFDRRLSHEPAGPAVGRAPSRSSTWRRSGRTSPDRPRMMARDAAHRFNGDEHAGCACCSSRHTGCRNIKSRAVRDWLDTDRYDIVAKAPDGSRPGSAHADDAGLLPSASSSRSSRDEESPIYALVMARSDGKRAKAHEDDGRLREIHGGAAAIRACARAGRTWAPGPGRFTPARTKRSAGVHGQHVPLPRSAGGPPPAGHARRRSDDGVARQRTLSSILNRQVIDRTGLAGLYDYELQYSTLRRARTARTAPAMGRHPRHADR